MSKTRCTAGKRLFTLGLSVLLAFGTMPTAANADEPAAVDGEGGTLIESQDEEYLGLPGDAVPQDGVAAGSADSDSNSDYGSKDEPTSPDLDEPNITVEPQGDEEPIVIEEDSDDEDIAVETQATTAGSTFATAYDVHVNDFFNYWYYDYLNKSSSEDFFKFQVPSAGKVTFKVQSPQGPPEGTGVGTQVYVSVFNSYNATSAIAEESIGKNYSMNTVSGSVSFELTQGIYWVRVSTARWVNRSSSSYYAPSTGGYYELYPSFTSAKETYVEYQNGSNNSKAAASGPISFGKTYKGQIAVNDTDDYYRINISNSGRVVFRLPKSAFNYYLYDATDGTGDYYQSGGHLSQSLKQSGKSRVFYTDLSAGTYYLRVSRAYAGDYGNYTIKLTYTQASESFYEGTYTRADNTVSTANSISFDQMYYGQLSATDFDDYYRFTTGANRTISVVVTPKTSNFDYVFLYVTDQYGGFSEYCVHPAGVFTVTVPYSYSTYYVRFSISRISNYDTGAYSFRLYNGEVQEMRWVDVAGIKYKYYTGKAIKPKPKVTYNGRRLTRNVDYKLSYKNNKKAGTATVTVKGIKGFYGTKKVTFKIIKPTVSYRTWIQGKAWKQKWKKNGKVAGITGEGRYIRYFKAELSGVRPDGGIQYIVNTEYAGSGSGWSTNWRQQWVSNGYAAGNDKQRIETIRIALYGEMKSYYNVYYRVHAQGFGWMGWAKNGARAGTEGMGKRVEAIQVVLVKKGGKAPAARFKGIERNYKKAYVSR